MSLSFPQALQRPDMLSNSLFQRVSGPWSTRLRSFFQWYAPLTAAPCISGVRCSPPAEGEVE